MTDQYVRDFNITNNHIQSNGGTYGTIRIGTPDLPGDAAASSNHNERLNVANNRVVSTMHPSPRVAIIPLFDPYYYDTGKTNGRNASLKLVNYLGFFIEEMRGNEVLGRITPVGGIRKGNGGPAPAAAFPKSIRLVQ